MFIGIDNSYWRGAICRNTCAEKLKDIPSGELEVLIKDILEKHGEEEVTSLYLMCADKEDDLFIVSGAADVLRDRHGQEYVLNLMELRSPRTLGEKCRYYLFNERFKLDTSKI